MRAVLLAAGLGQRLRSPAEPQPKPKPLETVAGRPLVSYTFDALATAGVSQVVAVTGFEAATLRPALAALSPLPITFRHNPHFRDGASRSLAAARDACRDEPFLLVMSDHLLDPRLVAHLAAATPRDGVLVAADAAPRDADYVDEATRILHRDGLVIDIGKQLPEWNALDAGAFHCSPAVWDALETAPPGCDLSTLFRILASDGRLRTADITGTFWYDVDTPEDRAAAEALLAHSRHRVASA